MDKMNKMKSVPCNGAPSTVVVIVLMMAGATLCGGIGAFCEFGNGDLGFQDHYIAENELDADTDVEAMLGHEYEILKESYKSQLTTMQVLKQCVIGNAATIGFGIGAALGFAIGLPIITCWTGGYLDENGWHISNESMKKQNEDNETYIMCQKKTEGQTGNMYEQMNFNESSHRQTRSGVLQMDSKKLWSSQELSTLAIKNKKNIKRVRYRSMGAALINKKLLACSVCFIVAMMIFGILTYSGTIPSMVGVGILTSLGVVVISGAVITLCGFGCYVGCLACCKGRRRLQATLFAEDQLPTLCIVLLISCLMIVCYVLQKINARAKATAAHLEQVVVKL